MSALLASLVALSTPLEPTSVFAHLGADAFVNFETPHVHPIEAASGRLLAVNTASSRLMIFDLASSTPTLTHGVAVGLDPVSVRVAPDGVAWVVNHLSDSISLVDVSSGDVVRTIPTDDEPADVVFAGGRAFVSCAQVNRVLSFDLTDLSASPTVIPIVGEEPRMLAVSPAGATVYAAIFESGNNTTVLGGGLEDASTLAFPPNVVSDPTGPYGGANPPPNNGIQFSPPRSPDASQRMPVSLIVRKDEAGQWRDDNIGNWTSLVSGAQATRSGRLPGWDLADHDVALIDVATNQVTYATGLMNICMALATDPSSGDVYVVGTDATNEVRFEPNLNGRFLRVNIARVDDLTLDATVVDLNPHLDYTTSTIPQSERDRSIGDPRGIVWAGTKGFVSGMGSNNVVVIDPTGARLAEPIEVGEGPTGL
ncbi:MAG: YncE family protein, partial [Phycisphaerales bacterium]|nr:YncE family protein [Phycisphaerales bacterium]